MSTKRKQGGGGGGGGDDKRGRGACGSGGGAAAAPSGVLSHSITATAAASLARGPHRGGASSVDFVHTAAEADPRHSSFSVRTGWLPPATHSSWREFLDRVLQAPAPVDGYKPSVQALADLLDSDPTLGFLVDNACKENANILASRLVAAEAVQLPEIRDREHFLNSLNALLGWMPTFINYELVGLPFSAFVVGLDPTLSGSTLFRLPQFNAAMSAILTEWHAFLGEPGVTSQLFGTEGEEWLSDQAKRQYQFEMWEKDSESLPYWSSWNSFFTRQFKDRQSMRPVAEPDNNAVAVSANDGSLFRWADGVGALEAFWFKDMQYSLADILSSPDPKDQAVLAAHNLVEKFADGSIFQTYLNPYNFHRWWVPVNGTVLFDPIVVPGCFFNKLVLPDFAGATTASLPYLAQVNARGLIVFDTPDIGLVCCVPLGMSEVSTISFDPTMKATEAVHKGDEMGRFQYGGSSFALIFQKLPGKRLVFQNAEGAVYDKLPVLPSGSAGAGGNVTLIGSQIGLWHPVSFSVDAALLWQNSGYVNTGKRYQIAPSGGVWTADPAGNDGNLYGPAGVPGGALAPQGQGFPMPGQPIGALAARIGPNAPFLVGGGTVQTPPGQVGQLQFCINGKTEQHEDNTGAVLLAITEVAA